MSDRSLKGHLTQLMCTPAKKTKQQLLTKGQEVVHLESEVTRLKTSVGTFEKMLQEKEKEISIARQEFMEAKEELDRVMKGVQDSVDMSDERARHFMTSLGDAENKLKATKIGLDSAFDLYRQTQKMNYVLFGVLGFIVFIIMLALLIVAMSEQI